MECKRVYARLYLHSFYMHSFIAKVTYLSAALAVKLSIFPWRQYDFSCGYQLDFQLHHVVSLTLYECLSSLAVTLLCVRGASTLTGASALLDTGERGTTRIQTVKVNRIQTVLSVVEFTCRQIESQCEIV